MIKPRLRYTIVVVLALAGVATLWFTRRGSDKATWVTEQGSVWTTDYHITHDAGRWLGDSIERTLAAVDGSASMFNASSLLSRLNANSTDSIDATIALLYATSVRVHRLSEGAYDPTVLPLVRAWGFGTEQQHTPTQHELDSLLTIVGLDKVRVARGHLTKSDPRVQIDFSSIAKGLACDELGRMLQRNGASNFLVEIGGEVMAHGSSPHGGPWHVMVDLPDPDTTTVRHSSALVVALDSGAVATSGNYRRWHESGGQRVSHIVDPHTGQATVSSLLSATIIARDCMTADAWATACMVLGTERTQQLLGDSDEVGVMTISVDTDGNMVVWSNANFAKHVTTQ